MDFDKSLIDNSEDSEEKTNEVKKAFDEMADAYKKCEEFEKSVVFPKNFILNEKEEDNEKSLLKQLKDSIDKWEKKLSDLRNSSFD